MANAFVRLTNFCGSSVKSVQIDVLPLEKYWVCTGSPLGAADERFLKEDGMSQSIATPARPVPSATPATPINVNADIPTFPLAAGWREVFDPNTGESQQFPLTLFDILYPNQDDDGVVVMPEGPLHDIWVTFLTTMLRTYITAHNWLILSDVLIDWGRKQAAPKYPDLAAIYGGHLPPEEEQSYRVGRDGPLPSFIIEVTSKETRRVDLNIKPPLYATAGVKELLIIDLHTRAPQPWRLLGYRLDAGPLYRELQPDAEGGLTFTTVGLRFVGSERQRLDVYDAVTGARLLTPTELIARAEAETEARIEAEARAAEYERQLRELEARYGLSGPELEKTE